MSDKNGFDYEWIVKATQSVTAVQAESPLEEDSVTLEHSGQLFPHDLYLLIPLILPVMWLLDKRDLRDIVVVGSAFNCIRAWIKTSTGDPHMFPMTFFGQFVFSGNGSHPRYPLETCILMVWATGGVHYLFHSSSGKPGVYLLNKRLIECLKRSCVSFHTMILL